MGEPTMNETEIQYAIECEGEHRSQLDCSGCGRPGPDPDGYCSMFCRDRGWDA